MRQAQELILSELDHLLSGQPGPYILSDLRYDDGPLYVRYGGFAERYCEDESGELVSAIEDASGRLVPGPPGTGIHRPRLDRTAPVSNWPIAGVSQG